VRAPHLRMVLAVPTGDLTAFRSLSSPRGRVPPSFVIVWESNRPFVVAQVHRAALMTCILPNLARSKSRTQGQALFPSGRQFFRAFLPYQKPVSWPGLSGHPLSVNFITKRRVAGQAAMTKAWISLSLYAPAQLRRFANSADPLSAASTGRSRQAADGLLAPTIVGPARTLLRLAQITQASANGPRVIPRPRQRPELSAPLPAQALHPACIAPVICRTWRVCPKRRRVWGSYLPVSTPARAAPRFCKCRWPELIGDLLLGPA